MGQLDLAGHLLLNLKWLTVQGQASAAPHNAPYLQLKGERLEDTGPLLWCTQDLECYANIHSYTHFALTVHGLSRWLVDEMNFSLSFPGQAFLLCKGSLVYQVILQHWRLKNLALFVLLVCQIILSLRK